MPNSSTTHSEIVKVNIILTSHNCSYCVTTFSGSGKTQLFRNPIKTAHSDHADHEITARKPEHGLVTTSINYSRKSQNICSRVESRWRVTRPKQRGNTANLCKTKKPRYQQTLVKL